ncbi:MAG: pseudouridine-5'-phosphate glycosidase, partial [Acidobacteriota bacterium]
MEQLTIAPEILSAIGSKRPIVALETTLVTHGFPHPEGLEVAHELESTIRSEGAIPATIGVVDGCLKVGIDRTELDALSQSKSAQKLNLSNLAARIAEQGLGSTTVAATMLAAHLSGIRVFATGGIGGVHRGASETGDVSSDLEALRRFPVAVVCAGAKAILDLPRTVEALESLGVPIFGVGTDQFPAFYRRESGLAVDRRFDDIGNLAAAVRTHLELGIGSGVVVANPIPTAAEMPLDLYETALTRAFEHLESSGQRGREVTPFLLEELRQATSGQS